MTKRVKERNVLLLFRSFSILNVTYYWKFIEIFPHIILAQIEKLFGQFTLKKKVRTGNEDRAERGESIRLLGSYINNVCFFGHFDPPPHWGETLRTKKIYF